MKTTLALILTTGILSCLSPLAAADLPQVDRSKPFHIDLWMGVPSKDALAKAGIDGKKDKLPADPSMGWTFPWFIGAVQVGTEIRQPYALPYEAWYTPHNQLLENDGNCPYAFFNFRQAKEDLQAFSCTITDTRISGNARVDLGGTQALSVAWEGTLNGNSIRGKVTMPLAEGRVLERPLVGVLRPTEPLDLRNSVYQIRFKGLVLVFEMHDGKAGQGSGRPWDPIGRPVAFGRLLPVDASQLTVTALPSDVRGASVALAGIVQVDGKPLEIPRTVVLANGLAVGQGNRGKRPEVEVQAYPLTDPVAARWRDWMGAIHAEGKPVDPALVQQAKDEAATIVALPAPSPATTFTHRHLEGRFIYAPWLPLSATAGAVKYRIELTPSHPPSSKPLIVEVAAAASVDLRPFWAGMAPGNYAVAITALDAGGAAIGTAQRSNLVKKVPFGSHPLTVIPDPIAMELALRFPRHLADHQYAFHTLFREIDAAGQNAVISKTIASICHSPWHLLVRWGTPTEQARGLVLADYFTKVLQWDADQPLGIQQGYKAMYFGAAQDWGRAVLDDFEVTKAEDRLALVRTAFDRLYRLQQPSGSWALMWDREPWPKWSGSFTMWNTAWLDHNGAAYALPFGRYRKLSGDHRYLDAELKAVRWVLRNSLRTGYWETQAQQGDPGYNRPTAHTMALDFLLYLLEQAPADQADSVLAEDVMRYLEDQFISWDRVPAVSGGTMTDNGILRLAIVSLLLHQRTGKPLHLAKAEALFTAYMLNRDPVSGLTDMRWNRYMSQVDDPAYALRYVELRRQVLAEKPALAVLGDTPLTLTLDRAAAGSERVRLHLDCRAGKIVQAIATTPTWQTLDIPFTTVSRRHQQEGETLFHAVDASGLKVGPQGVEGSVSVALTAPGGKPVPTVFNLTAAPAQRALVGTWSQGTATGRVAGEVLSPGVIKPTHLHLQIAQAVAGGESWQDWALLRTALVDGSATGAVLGNANAGWRASTTACDLRLGADGTFSGSLATDVRWIGFMDNNASDEAKTKEWKSGTLDWLAYWKLGGPGTGRGNEYEPGFRPLPWPEHTKLPGMDDKSTGQLEYITTSKPVTPGTYRIVFAGRRLGDLVAGTATVDGPDGKKHVSQCFGSVEGNLPNR